MKRGLPPPERSAVLDADLDPEHTDLWEAFLDLKSSASCGWSPDPVSPSDVHAWCELHGVPSWRWRTFWRVVHALDAVHRREVAQQTKAERKES